MSSHVPGRRLAPPRVEEVSGGIFAYVQDDGSWWINNTGFLVGSRAITGIDTCSTEHRTRQMLDAIGTVSPAPVRTLVNTHHHGDHTHGNYLVDTATIVAHERCREELLAAGPPGPLHDLVWEAPDWGDIRLAPPTLTFRDEITLWVDDLRCEVRHLGTPAHTTNDVIVWIPERGVLFTGDLVFNGGTPFLLMGSLTGALEATRALLDLGATTIVPGHGDVCGPDAISRVIEYLEFLEKVAADAHAAGVGALEAARGTDLGRFAELTDSERLAGNLHRALAELDGAARGAPIDVGAALGDMIALNGGNRLSCYA